MNIRHLCLLALALTGFAVLFSSAANAACGFDYKHDFLCNGAKGDPYDIDTPDYDNSIRQRPPTGPGDTDYIPPDLGDTKGTCTPVSDETFNQTLQFLKLREGVRRCVYQDSLGKLTVGVGHLVLPGDNLKAGDCISDDRVNQLLQKDSRTAWNAALAQAREAGINDANFVKVLTSVNYQLGTGWRSKFPRTWALIKAGKYEEAAADIQKSLWAQQTPVRTRDFQQALYALASCAKEK